MEGLVLLISLSLLAVCQAAVPPVRCGELPTAVYRCLGTPHIVQPGLAAQCKKDTECEKITCIFKKSGWMDGDSIDKPKLTEYFEQFARDNPDWQTAVNQAKSNCLQGELLPQSIHLNCPAFDVMHCSFATFLKYAQPSQWSSSEACAYPRQFAAACPVCPADCFAPQIPIGSCNACLALPRSP